MKKSFKFGLAGLALLLVAAATGDRLKTPVKIGQGNAGTKSIIFDSGDGASDAQIFSTSKTNISFEANGNVTSLDNGTFTPDSHIENQSGTAANPTYSFSGDTDTGMYHSAANTIDWSVNGARGLELTPTGLQANGIMATGDGAVGLPAYTFANESTMGMYRGGTQDLRFAINGIRVAYIVPSGLASDGNLFALSTVQTGNGSVSTPSYTFQNDTSTGIYSGGSGSGQIDFSGGGTNTGRLSTSGLELPAGNGAFRLKIINLGSFTGTGGTVTAAHGLTTSSFRGMYCTFSSSANHAYGNDPAVTACQGGTTNITATLTGAGFSDTYTGYAVVLY